MVSQSQVGAPKASWASIAGGVQGGLVAGLLLPTDAPDGVRAATVHFLRRVEAGVPAERAVQEDRGGSTRSLRAELSQSDRLVAVAQVLAVPVTAGAPPLHVTVGAEAVGSPADGKPFDGLAPFVPFAQHLEIRALGDDMPLAGGPHPRLQAWVRLRPAVSLPPLVQLAVLADALPPASFAVLSAPVLLPTVELTLHLAGPLPATGAWVRIQQETAWAAADVVVDDAVLHDEDGHLVARVRQTRRAYPHR